MTHHNIDDLLEIPLFLRRDKSTAPKKMRIPRKKKIKSIKLNLVKAPAAWETAKEVTLQPAIDWPKSVGPCYARRFLVKPTRSKKFVYVREAYHAFGYHAQAWEKNEKTKQPELTKVVRGVRPVIRLTTKQFNKAKGDE